MSNNKIIYDAFNIYYNRGMEALEANNLEVAKRNLYSAAESLLKLAKDSQGVLKAERLKRAEELAAMASKIERKQRGIGRSDSDAIKSDIRRVTGRGEADDEDDSGTTFTPIEPHSLITLDDVAGLNEAKDAIRRLVIEPRKHPEVYERFKKKAGGGILLYGVPGTGKTMFAKAIANELDAKFFQVKCSDIESKFVGDSEKNVRKLFDEARKYPNSIIFFDEFEAIGSARDSKHKHMSKIVDELLQSMDGFEENENNLLFLAATNRPWDIDSALLRPGRFNCAIYVPLPDEDARRVIINNSLSGVPVSESVNIEDIVTMTNGFNGADVVEFCERLKDCPIRRTIDSGVDSKITSDDVRFTGERATSSVRLEDLKKIDNYRSNER